MSHAPQALQTAGGIAATGMGQPALGLPMLAGGLSSMGAPDAGRMPSTDLMQQATAPLMGGGPMAALGQPGAQQGLAGLGMLGQGMMQGRPQQPQMQPPQQLARPIGPQPPFPGSPNSMGLPQLNMGAPQGGGGMNPQMAAMLRQMMGMG